MNGTFLEANNLIIKISFLLLIVVVFSILFRIFIIISAYIFEYDKSPYLVKGLLSGNKKKSISQDPNNDLSVPIFRSVNQSQGIEFTWSVWLNIDDINSPNNAHKHIFHKGNTSQQHTEESHKGVYYPNNAPGLYLKPNSNTLLVVMNTFKNITEEIEIPDIPLKKWVNVMIRVEGRNVDVYINGVIKARRELNDVPKQNYDNVYVNMNGGFSGYMSDLKYFDHGVNMREINQLVYRGPDLTSTDNNLESSKPPYLSIDWYLSP